MGSTITQKQYMQSILNMLSRFEKDLEDPKLPLTEKKYIEGKYDSCQSQLSLLSQVTIIQESIDEENTN